MLIGKTIMQIHQKIVSCGLSLHVKIFPFPSLLIFCLPNKSCMSLHPYFNQFCFRNIYQISRSIKKTVFHCVPYTNNPAAQNIHCSYPHHKVLWGPGLQRVPNLSREGDYINALQKILFCCRTFRAKLPYVPS